MYRLKTDLSKRRFSQILIDYLPAGVSISRPSDCYFRRHRGYYWLSWSNEDGYYEASFCVFAGSAHLCIDKSIWPEDGEFVCVSHDVVIVPFDYLLKSDCLKCVA